jgi:hypothetical protein
MEPAIATSPSEAAREWMAATLRSHFTVTYNLVMEQVAEAAELETYQDSMPFEPAIELAIEWCEG